MATSYKNDLIFTLVNLTQQRYHGFMSTPFLWENEMFSMKQYSKTNSNSSISLKIPETIRLGNYVEHLVFHELKQDPTIEILCKNVQIIHNKQTLGEIDCVLKKKQIPVHLEIAYKFYLYDDRVGRSHLDHWIGPNRRDSLVLKLNKTRDKQFPLLYHKACQPLIKELNISMNLIEQQSYFKAQLFLPYNTDIDIEEINPDCIVGFYLNIDDFQSFKHCKFYIPKKLDWLIEPHKNVAWLNFEDANQRIYQFFERGSSPLLWLKVPEGEIKKIFVVWWT